MNIFAGKRRGPSLGLALLLLVTACKHPGVIGSAQGSWTALPTSQTLTLPGELVGLRAGPLTLSGQVNTPSVAGPRWLSLGTLDFPCEVNFNGTLVYQRGHLTDAWVQSSFAACFLVPDRLWAPEGQANRVTVNLLSHGARMRFPSALLIGNQEFADFQHHVVELWNADFFFLFFGVNFVGGLYFFSVWVGRRVDRSRLWFAFSTILMSLYFFELGSPVPLFSGPSYRSLMKACLSWSVGWALVFFLEYFPIHRARRWKALAATVFLISGFWVATATDPATLAERFTQSLIPLEIAILFVIYLLVHAWLSGHGEAQAIFVGTVVAVALGTHDVVYQIRGEIPVAWMQGIGFFALQASMFLSLALQSNRLYREVEATNLAFARFVPREFLSFLGKKSITDVALGDQVQRHMAVLFSDIRDFTSLSERLTPTENFNLINAYLNHMVPQVRQHGGIVDKYIGDAIMALYAGGSGGALLSALAMRDSLESYNQGRLRAGYSRLEMGIGIHTGSLMLGTIGDQHRMDGTVISDVVNTASRLQGLTRAFGVSIIVSGSALAEVPALRSQLDLRYLGRTELRGRTASTALFELIATSDPWREAKPALRAEFEDAVRTWESGVGGDRSALEAYQRRFPDDPALGFFGLKG